MGAYVSTLWNFMFKTDPVRVLLVGLDGSGKTTALYKLRFGLGEVVNTYPTAGFIVDTVAYKNPSFLITDVGGSDKLRRMMYHHHQNSQAVIYVVDSHNVDRLREARQELSVIPGFGNFPDVPLLVLANKQELPVAVPVAELTDKFGLKNTRDRQWHIQGASSVKGEGLHEALDWIAKQPRVVLIEMHKLLFDRWSRPACAVTRAAKKRLGTPAQRANSFLQRVQRGQKTCDQPLNPHGVETVVEMEN